jgi:hypothetical protein
VLDIGGDRLERTMKFGASVRAPVAALLKNHRALEVATRRGTAAALPRRRAQAGCGYQVAVRPIAAATRLATWPACRSATDCSGYATRHLTRSSGLHRAVMRRSHNTMG